VRSWEWIARHFGCPSPNAARMKCATAWKLLIMAIRRSRQCHPGGRSGVYRPS
jgi:hypothetical protein